MERYPCCDITQYSTLSRQKESHLHNAGIDLYVVKEWLGHSSIQVTKRYAHLAPHKLAHAALKLEEIG
jgi:site-specific recombinase XerD